MNDASIHNLASKVMQIVDKELQNYFMVTFGKIPSAEIRNKHGLKTVQGNVTEYTWKQQPVLRVKMETELNIHDVLKATVTIKRDFIDGGKREHVYTLIPENMVNADVNSEVAPDISPS